MTMWTRWRVRMIGTFMKRLRIGAITALAVFAMLVGTAAPAYAWTEHDNFIADGHGWFQPQNLVVHSTANEGATAWNHVQYWQRMGNDTPMAQWVADWTDGGTVYQTMSGNAVAWHVGNGNWYSVGIEICEATNQHDFEVGFDTAAQWCAVYLNQQGWGIDRMVSHNEARYVWGGTDHVDPIPYFAKWGKTWGDFENLVQYYLDNPSAMTYDDGEGSAPDTPEAPVTGSIEEAAYGVLQGWYGNQPERQYNLEAAGYDYQTVQDYVNRVYYGIGGGSTGSDWIADVAYDVYLGNYGNGQDRYDRLTAAGYDYQTVQDYVNSVYYGI